MPLLVYVLPKRAQQMPILGKYSVQSLYCGTILEVKQTNKQANKQTNNKKT